MDRVELIKKAKSMKAGEQYRLICLEEDIIDSGIEYNTQSQLFKELLDRSGQVVTLLSRTGHQWSTRELVRKDRSHHWYFNADCFVPLDAL